MRQSGSRRGDRQRPAIIATQIQLMRSFPRYLNTWHRSLKPWPGASYYMMVVVARAGPGDNIPLLAFGITSTITKLTHAHGIQWATDAEHGFVSDFPMEKLSVRGLV